MGWGCRVSKEKVTDLSARVANFTLPMPPSTNALFFNAGHGRQRTKVYNDWRKEAGWEIKRQRIPAISGRVIVDILLEENKRRDADNAIKGILDLLVDLCVIQSDRSDIVRSVSATWGGPPGANVTIKGL